MLILLQKAESVCKCKLQVFMLALRFYFGTLSKNVGFKKGVSYDKSGIFLNFVEPVQQEDQRSP